MRTVSNANIICGIEKSINYSEVMPTRKSCKTYTLLLPAQPTSSFVEQQWLRGASDGLCIAATNTEFRVDNNTAVNMPCWYW